MFHVHLDRDRSRRSTCGTIMPATDRYRKCFDFKRRHMACCCVCMQVNEAEHPQRLKNMLKHRLRKWFFREEVDFLSSLAFVVN